MSEIERWTIHPAQRIHHEDGISMALGHVEPRPETDSDPFEVVRASDYERAATQRDDAIADNVKMRRELVDLHRAIELIKSTSADGGQS